MTSQIRIGTHFTLVEFTQSQTAIRKNISNDPPPNIIAKIASLVGNVLDPLRDKIGQPIRISSGYRSPTLNKLIGGAKGSQHTLGEAADIYSPTMSAEDLFKFIRASDLPYDQLIFEGTWVHVSYRPNPRKQALIAHFTNGGVTYSPA